MNNQLKNVLYGIGAGLLGRPSCVHTLHSEQQIRHPQNFLRVFHQQNTQDFALAFTGERGGDVYVTSSDRITQDTPFRLASVTKLVIGIALMRLQERGCLDLEADVSDYLEHAVRNPRYPEDRITLRHLLSHSSGLIDSPAYFTALRQPVGFQELLAYHEGRPGERFAYSNLAAGLVEIIVERLTGKSLEQVLQEEIFFPLGIAGTLFPQRVDAAPPIYRVFPRSEEASYRLSEKILLENEAYRNRPLEERYIKAAGALFMSASGLMTLLKALLRDSREGSGILLTPESLRVMQSPLVHYPKPQRRLSHGIATLIIEDDRIYPGRLYGHQGFAYGAVNGVFYDPQRQKAIVSLNAGTREWRNGHFSVYTEQLLRCIQRECV